jgi:hypothetical protein
MGSASFKVKIRKFGAEVITYFPSIQHGLHRKQNNYGRDREQGELASLLTKIRRGTQAVR